MLGVAPLPSRTEVAAVAVAAAGGGTSIITAALDRYA
jgi:hypothetical protein